MVSLIGKVAGHLALQTNLVLRYVYRIPTHSDFARVRGALLGNYGPYLLLPSSGHRCITPDIGYDEYMVRKLRLNESRHSFHTPRCFQNMTRAPFLAIML